MSDKTSMETPRWYSIREAAEYLAVGEQTIYRWMRDGRITFRKIGDSTRFMQCDLDEVVQVFHSKKEVEKVRQSCPVCHHELVAEGALRSTGLIYFRPEKAKFWSLHDANVKTKAVMCPNCGAVTLFGDTIKLEKLLTKTTVESEKSVEEKNNGDNKEK